MMPFLLQILAIVAMSYDELQKKAEEEEEAALAEEEALRVSDTSIDMMAAEHLSGFTFYRNRPTYLSAPSLYKVVSQGGRGRTIECGIEDGRLCFFSL